MKYKKRSEVLEDNSLVLASIFTRLLAFSTDIIIIMMLYILLQVSVQLLGFDLKSIHVESFTHVDFEAGHIGSVARFMIKSIITVIPILYFTLTVFFLNGQTLGKKIFKIRVISLYHHKTGIWHCLERSLGYVASGLEFGLGFIQALWNPNKMSLHDKIAETIVVKIKRTMVK